MAATPPTSALATSPTAPEETGVDGRTYAGLRLYRRVMGEARPWWRHIAGLFVLSLFSSLFALLTPLPLMIAVDSVVGSEPLPGFIAAFVPASVSETQTGVLLIAAGLFVLIALFKQLQQFGQVVLAAYTGEKLLFQFRGRLFRHAERLSLAYHDSRGATDSTYRIQYDATAVQTIAVSGLIPFLTAIVTVAAMLYVIARIDWQLALVALAVVPILFFAMRAYRKRLRARWHDAKRLDSSALSVVHESLEALRVVKAFGREDHARDRFAARSAASVRAKIDLSVIEGRFGVVVGVTIGLGTAVILFLGTRHVLAGVITLGELVLVIGYLQQFYDPLKTASKKVASLQSSLASAERVYSLLDEASDVVDPPGARSLARAAGAVAFRNVSFAYEPGQRVLRDVSFEVAPGTRLGVAGTTGAGKTTLMSLLTRFYDPTSGQILLDGVDLREYRLGDLRSQFAIVLQEPVLFSASIAENIAYARPDAADDEIVAAAKAASADDFIRALPDGYETLAGERGVRLSGGERQRIALARAFLKDAPILILDEPTSSVDARTEGEILEAMERLMSGRTAFMITHRASTLEICDARLELEHGRVVTTTLTRGGRPRRTRKRIAVAGGSRVRTTTPGRHGRVPASRSPVDLPVLRAWRTISPARTRVHRVASLHTQPKDEIYRLTVANDATSIIAKRGRKEALLVERTIYENILPRLPSPGLRYHGFVAEEDGEFAWLFIEDAGDDRCSLAQHGPLAARWLGTLHGAAAELDLAPSLPERGPGHYLAHLRSARTSILDSFDNPALRAHDRSTLHSVLTACDLVESSWDAAVAMCVDLPRTLVHGDLVEKNLRIRHDEHGPAIVAFDWECSGVGVPAADVYELAVDATGRDLSCYRSEISEFACGGLDEDKLRRLLLMGDGFRLLASVDWASSDLRHAWPEKGTSTLRGYERRLWEWGHRIATVT